MSNYEVNLTWNKDGKGLLSSPVLSESIEVVTPPEFSKGIAGAWSPENFFVASVNSCLMTTFLAVAENSKLEFEKFSSNAIGKLDKVDGKLMITEIILRPILVIKMLPRKSVNLNEISFKLGYSSVAHLSAQFKKVTGLTPSQFKAQGIHLRKTLDEV